MNKPIITSHAPRRNGLRFNRFLAVALLCTETIACGQTRTSRPASVPIPAVAILTPTSTLVTVKSDGTVEERKVYSGSSAGDMLKAPVSVAGITNAVGVAIGPFWSPGRPPIDAPVAILADGGIVIWTNPLQVRRFSGAEVAKALGGLSILSIRDETVYLSDGTADSPGVLGFLQGRDDLAEHRAYHDTLWKRLPGLPVKVAADDFAAVQTGDLYNLDQKGAPQPILKGVVDLDYYEQGHYFWAVRNDGTLWTGTKSDAPRQISTVSNVKAVFGSSSLVLTKDGLVFISDSKLGRDGYRQVTGLKDVRDISYYKPTNEAVTVHTDGNASLILSSFGTQAIIPLGNLSLRMPK